MTWFRAKYVMRIRSCLERRFLRESKSCDIYVHIWRETKSCVYKTIQTLKYHVYILL